MTCHASLDRRLKCQPAVYLLQCRQNVCFSGTCGAFQPRSRTIGAAIRQSPCLWQADRELPKIEGDPGTRVDGKRSLSYSREYRLRADADPPPGCVETAQQRLGELIDPKSD